MNALPLTDKNLAIRPYQEDVDFPCLVAFIAMQYEHEREYQKLARKHGGAIAPNYARNLIEITSTHKGCIFIALSNGNPIGFIASYCLFDPDPILHEAVREHALVRDLFVLPNWRRMHVADQLLRVTEHFFSNKNIAHIRLFGPAQCEALIELCKKNYYQSHMTVFDKKLSPTPTSSILTNEDHHGSL